MKSYIRIFFLFIFLLFVRSSYSQNNKLDSILTAYKNSKEDTTKIELATEFIVNNENLKGYSKLYFLRKCLSISEKINFKRGIAKLNHTIGRCYEVQDLLDSARYYYINALEFAKQMKDTVFIGKCYIDLGLTYHRSNPHSKYSIPFLDSAICIFKKTKNIKLLRAYNRKFEVLIERDSFISAKKVILEAVKITNELSEVNIQSKINLTENIGQYYFRTGQYDSALIMFNQCFEFSQKTNNLFWESYIRSLFADLYLKQNNYKLAINNGELGLKIALENNLSKEYMDNLKVLYKIHKSKGDYQKALGYYEKLNKITDSINSNVLEASSKRFEDQIVIKKNKTTINQLQNEKEIEYEKSKRRKILIWFTIGGFIIVIIFSLFIYSRWRITNKQKEVIEGQKHLIEEKHKEITDSINYAERIQRSFIATKQLLDENLSEYFVVFKPKDVVSGDFYWAATLQEPQGSAANSKFILVTADSTGHGVPGAIMSLLNVTSLETALKDGYCEPAYILNSTRKTIIERLKKDGSPEGGKDGMDASLCVYDFKNKKLSIAAANNPVWIIRNSGTETLEVLEIKPDKMPIGKHDKDSISFTQQEIDLQKGDVVYTLTDGFPDQFGGPNGKKFMSKNLRELLAANAHLPMNEQKELLENTFADWVGNMEQVDDVTLIGVRV